MMDNFYQTSLRDEAGIILNYSEGEPSIRRLDYEIWKAQVLELLKTRVQLY